MSILRRRQPEKAPAETDAVAPLSGGSDRWHRDLFQTYSLSRRISARRRARDSQCDIGIIDPDPRYPRPTSFAMAPAPSHSPNPSVALHALYTAPHPPTSHTFSHPISLPATSASPQEEVKAKSAYLAELKGLVTQLQGEINVFLTERMEEDKKAAEAQGKKDADREAKEEENYGEEDVEDEA